MLDHVSEGAREITGYEAAQWINGRIAWAKGEFPGLDEARLAAEAEAVLARTLA